MRKGNLLKWKSTNIVLTKATEVQLATMKKKKRKESYRKARAILKTKLNSATQIQAISTLAILGSHLQFQYNQLEFVRHQENRHENSYIINV